MKIFEVKTHLTSDQIARRVEQVENFNRFSVFSFPFHGESHADEVLSAEGIQVTNRDGVYFGEVVDYNDAYFYVNLH